MKVPVGPLKEIMQEWVQRNPLEPINRKHNSNSGAECKLGGDQLSPLTVLAEFSGVSTKTIYNIMAENVKAVQFDIADALVSAMHCNEEWHLRLADYYRPSMEQYYTTGFSSQER